MGANKKGIFDLGIYEPSKIYDYGIGEKIKNPSFNKKTGGYLLDFKEGKENAINRYFNKMEKKVLEKNKNLLESGNYGITCVPSSKEGQIGKGLEKLIAMICEKYKIENMCGNLSRKYDIEKQAHGGLRKLEIHLDSIEVLNESLFKDRNIIIIDDITTTGISLNACEKIVEDCGAKKIRCIALGKTVNHY